MPLSGFVKSRIEDAIWMVPRYCAVWIPSETPHSNEIEVSADICMLFVDPDIEGLPEKTCTLSVSPLLRELVVKLASEEKDYDQQGRVGRLAEVLIDELVSMPTERFEFPIPSEPRLNKLAYWMLEKPNNQTSIKQWAQRLAMSDRTLSRLVKQELGMTFGQWLSLSFMWWSCYKNYHKRRRCSVFQRTLAMSQLVHLSLFSKRCLESRPPNT